ncbi:MAG: N-acetylmuramoyl-L-alanine amidase [Propionibacteriaceae bacterium]|jgi:hypothetical protein|nr:N-acetylmuramoyl-L-alanine amidase [Propionibacteriaceae bacterium]
MDYEHLVADKNVWMTTHFTPGRTAPISEIRVHHNAGTLTTEDCHRVWQTRQASAHYQVEIDGIIGQLVHDQDTAWHTIGANARSISVEHANDHRSPWTISPATLEAGAHLVAALCVYYHLGRPEWGVNVKPHRHNGVSDCPGELGDTGSQHSAYMDRAQYWYDQMTTTTPPTTNQPTPDTLSDGRVGPDNIRLYQTRHGLTPDGNGGTDTIASLQRDAGAPYTDGWIDLDTQTQVDQAETWFPGITTFRATGGTGGSPSWKAIQYHLLGTEPDGIPGPNDATAFQRALREGRM